MAGAALIGFADPETTVMVNEPVRLVVTIDYAGGATHSLFSYGVSILGDWETQGIVPIGVDVPVALDFNGVAGSGAFVRTGDGFMGVKGTVNLSVNPIEVYPGTVLAEFELLFTRPGSYSLGLELFNTLGPTEDIFVNQEGLSIDDELQFGPGLVHVAIPEPGISTLLLATAAALLIRCRKYRRRLP